VVADLQDPPEMIPEFIQRWRQGFKVVIGIKPESEEHRLMFFIRRLYYKVVGGMRMVPKVHKRKGSAVQSFAERRGLARKSVHANNSEVGIVGTSARDNAPMHALRFDRKGSNATNY
jgi:hypothetical protein